MPDIPDSGHLPGLRRFPWRFVVYGCVLLYLLGDLYLFGGPLRRRIDIARGSAAGGAAEDLARSERIVATVYAHPIRSEDLDRAEREYCRRRGLLESELPRKRRNAIRAGALDELVVDRLIWFHSRHTPVESSEAQLSAARQLAGQGIAGSEPDFEAALADQGLSRERFDMLVENRAMQEAWIEATIAPHLGVADEELAARYSEFSEGLEAPPAFETVRFELLATLEAEKRRIALDALINQLKHKAGSHIRYFGEFIWVD